MKQIELYDILTLSNDKEYTVLRMIDLEDKTYYLLAEIDEEENPILDELKIVEVNGNDTLTEIKEENLLKELTELFASALEADI